jgi:hypothetical protein
MICSPRIARSRRCRSILRCCWWPPLRRLIGRNGEGQDETSSPKRKGSLITGLQAGRSVYGVGTWATATQQYRLRVVCYTMYRRGSDEIVLAADAATGKTIWEYRYNASFRGNLAMDNGSGPHATPLVTGNGVLRHRNPGESSLPRQENRKSDLVARSAQGIQRHFDGPRLRQ